MSRKKGRFFVERNTLSDKPDISSTKQNNNDTNFFKKKVNIKITHKGPGRSNFEKENKLISQDKVYYNSYNNKKNIKHIHTEKCSNREKFFLFEIIWKVLWAEDLNYEKNPNKEYEDILSFFKTPLQFEKVRLSK
jgi:hypothetical protein